MKMIYNFADTFKTIIIECIMDLSSCFGSDCMYNDQILDHLCNPRNAGSMDEPDGVGRSGNSMDGDKVTIYIKVKDEMLIDIKFQTYGCGAAIAASSMVTVLAKNKRLDEALRITNELVAGELGGMPENKIKCSNIAADALHDAINNYLDNVRNRTK